MGGSSCVLPTDVGSAVLSELLAAVEEEAMVEGVVVEGLVVKGVVVEGVVVEGVVVKERGVSGCGHTSSRTYFVGGGCHLVYCPQKLVRQC